jgi:predicted nucleic acid-binding protein
VIVCDSSGILAAIDRTQSRHHEAKSAIESIPGPYLVSPFVVAELDYMITRRIGPHAAKAFLRDVANGSYRLEAFGPDDVAAALNVIEKYADHAIGLADASNVVVAARYGITRILTLDERHFRVLRSTSGEPFELVPLRD